MTNSHKMNNGQNKKTERRKNEQLARRTAIIKAAREVFFAKGFMNATIDEIADRCGLAKGTIYLYFRSKEELYASIMAEGMERLRKEFEALRNQPPGEKGLVETGLSGLIYGFYHQEQEVFQDHVSEQPAGPQEPRS